MIISKILECYSAITRINNAICSNMKGPRDYHTKWSQSHRERQISYDTTYTEFKKNDTSALIYETETDSET